MEEGLREDSCVSAYEQSLSSNFIKSVGDIVSVQEMIALEYPAKAWAAAVRMMV